MIGSLGQDLRHAARMLLKQPGFTFVALVTLALGIGANAAIFSLVHRALIRPLPFPEPERLVTLWNRYDKFNVPRTSVSTTDAAEFRAARSFTAAAAFEVVDQALTGLDRPALVSIARTNPSLERVLQTRPARGRWFREEEDQPGADAVVVISDAMWKKRFGGDPGIVGQTLRLDGRVRTVVGVMPRGFDFPTEQIGQRLPRAEAWVPLALSAAQQGPDHRQTEYLMVIARLRDGVTLAGAQAELNGLAQRVMASPEGAEYREYGYGHVVSSLSDDAVKPLRTPLLLLFGAVAFVLLIACSNVSHLLLARVASRRREIALRTALGASSGRIAQQFLVESVLLAVGGGVLGLGLGMWSSELLGKLPMNGLPPLDGLGLDPLVIGFTLGLSLLTGMLFGTLPALQALRTEPNEALKETSAAGGARRTRLRNALVTAEVALTVVLLVGAGLAIRSLQELLAVPPGFDPHHAVTVRTTLPENRYAAPAQQAAVFERVVRDLQSQPGVEAVGGAVSLPLQGSGWRRGLEIPGAPPTDRQPLVYYRPIVGDYFKAMGIPLEHGTLFSPAARSGASAEVVIDDVLASRHFAGRDPVGQTIRFGETDFRIVGVVGSVKMQRLDDPEVRASAYVPLAVSPVPTMAFVVRTRQAAGPAIAALTAAIESVDPELPVYEASAIGDVVLGSAASPRARATLLGMFAVLATFLAALGIYGLVSYGVTQRTKEIGVRMALGASRDHVLGVVVRQGLQPILTGLALGLVGALFLSRLMASQLYGIRTSDPATYVAIALLVVLVALAAMIVPARRALSLDPMLALRYE